MCTTTTTWEMRKNHVHLRAQVKLTEGLGVKVKGGVGEIKKKKRISIHLLYNGDITDDTVD